MGSKTPKVKNISKMADTTEVEQVLGCKTTKQTVKIGAGKVVEAGDTGEPFHFHFLSSYPCNQPRIHFQ